VEGKPEIKFDRPKVEESSLEKIAICINAGVDYICTEKSSACNLTSLFGAVRILVG
jgi:hypothetical protein